MLIPRTMHCNVIMVIICNKLKLFREVKLEHIGTLKSWSWKITFKIKQLPVFRSFSKTSGVFQNYSTSSDPHRDKLCCHSFKHLIWKLFLHIFWRSILAFYLTFCQFWHSTLAFYLASILTSYLASILESILIFYLAFFLIPYLASILTFSLRSGAEIWRSQLRSSSAHWDLELVVVRQGARSCNPRQEGGRRRKTEAERGLPKEKATLIKSRDRHLTGGGTNWEVIYINGSMNQRKTKVNAPIKQTPKIRSWSKVQNPQVINISDPYLFLLGHSRLLYDLIPNRKMILSYFCLGLWWYITHQLVNIPIDTSVIAHSLYDGWLKTTNQC